MIVDSHCHAWTTWPYDTARARPAAPGHDRAAPVRDGQGGRGQGGPHLRPHRPQPRQQRVRVRGVAALAGPDRPVPGHRFGLVAGVPHAGCRRPVAGRHRPLGDRRLHPLCERGERRLADQRRGYGVLRARRGGRPDRVHRCRRAVVGGPAHGRRARTRRCPSSSTTRAWRARRRAPDSETLREVLACASVPNIIVKASGFYYGSAAWAEYPYPDQRAIFRRIADAFGPRRLAWGSDYPVAPWVACTFRQTLDVVRVHCADFLSSADLGWVMGDTLETLLRTRRPVSDNRPAPDAPTGRRVDPQARRGGSWPVRLAMVRGSRS